MISESEELFVTSEELFVSSEELFVSSEELFVSSGDSFMSSDMAASPLVVSTQNTFVPFKPAMFPREHSRRLPSVAVPPSGDSRTDGHDCDSYLYLPQTPWRNAWHGKGPGGQIGFGMSQGGEGPDGFHTPGYLSWRKLQLSRAKLKASSKTSALLSGFAMVAMVEVQLNTDSKVPDGMLVAFAICTTLLVAVHMLALMISTCILPNIDAVCNLHSIALVHESPHERLHWYIETAWAFSTLLGLLLFLLEIAILCWVKFYDLSPIAAWSACVVLIPVLIVFLAFAVHFYRTLVTHKYEVTVSGIRELEMLKEQMEQGDDRANNGMGLLDRDRIQIV